LRAAAPKIDFTRAARRILAELLNYVNIAHLQEKVKKQRERKGKKNKENKKNGEEGGSPMESIPILFAYCCICTCHAICTFLAIAVR
jgi:hypothetical protein